MLHRCKYNHGQRHVCRCKCGASNTNWNRAHKEPWDTDFGCHGQLIWVEDDATLSDPDRETLSQAYIKYTGKRLDARADAIGTIDVGDGEYCLMPTGTIIMASYPGANQLWKAEGLRIYLDDVRSLPETFASAGYYLVRNPEHVLKYITENGLGSIEVISLDNDLGGKIEGRHVLDEIERRVVARQEYPPVVHVHSANPVAQQAMKVVIDRLAGLAFQLALVRA